MGLGAAFKVWLPLHERNDFTPLETEAAQDSKLAGVRVLLVDDMEDALYPFALLLEAKGMVVSSVTTGQRALELADAQDFDLIVSDIGMPGMDGYELIEKMRNKPRTARVPAIALTGYGRPEEVQRALRSGFSAHLDKPLNFERLVALLRDLLPRGG